MPRRELPVHTEQLTVRVSPECRVKIRDLAALLQVEEARIVRRVLDAFFIDLDLSKFDGVEFNRRMVRAILCESQLKAVKKS